MLPNNSPEGTPQAPAGGQEQPTSEPSGAQGSPLPEYVVALQNQLADLTKMVRGVQSGADKQIGQVRGDIKRILELKDRGLDESQIQRELWIDQQMNGQIAPQNAPAQQPAGSGQTSTGLDVDSMISALKFEPNDPALAALRIKYGNNPQQFAQAAADLRLNQLQSPNPTPGTGLPTGSGPAGGATNWDALAAEYEQLAKNPAANFQRMTEIKQEMDKIR